MHRILFVSTVFSFSIFFLAGAFVPPPRCITIPIDGEHALVAQRFTLIFISPQIRSTATDRSLITLLRTKLIRTLLCFYSGPKCFQVESTFWTRFRISWTAIFFVDFEKLKAIIQSNLYVGLTCLACVSPVIFSPSNYLGFCHNKFARWTHFGKIKFRFRHLFSCHCLSPSISVLGGPNQYL